MCGPRVVPAWCSAASELCCLRNEDHHMQAVCDHRDYRRLVLECGINKHGSFSVTGESYQPGNHPFFLHFCCTKFILKWKKTALKINTALLCVRLYAVLKLGSLGVL